MPALAPAHDYSGLSAAQLFEGFAAHGHLDVGLSADGRRVRQFSMQYRALCGKPGHRKLVRSGASLLGRPPRISSRGRFRYYASRNVRAYHDRGRLIVRGRVTDRGRRVTLTYDNRVHFGTGVICTARGRLSATRWAPADWAGSTAAGRPVTFHVGGFTGPAAPVIDLRATLPMSCDDGTHADRPFTWPDAAEVTISTNIRLRGTDARLRDSTAASGDTPNVDGTLWIGERRRTRMQVTGRFGERMTYDETTERDCQGPEMRFSARPVR
jgi:hypothetical protein